MKNFTYLIISIGIGLLNSITVMSQTPADAVMMNKHEACLAIIYDGGAFDQYFEGTNLRKNATIATVSRNTILPMIAIGIHDRLNLIVAAPYVRTKSSEPNGGKFAGANGFQDLSIVLKGKIVERTVGSGKLAVLSTIGYSTPMTNYLSDYMPYSLGFGANEWSVRGIVNYKLDMGLYAIGSFSYLWRGQTKAERDYYYNNGSYYTPWMDVPSAWNYNVAVGSWLLNNSLRIEAGFVGLKSTSGDDIRSYNAPQPTNKVVFDQVGFTAQYFFKKFKVKGLGVLANYSQVVNGRNSAKIRNIAGGITYQFKFLDRTNNEK